MIAKTGPGMSGESNWYLFCLHLLWNLYGNSNKKKSLLLDVTFNLVEESIGPSIPLPVTTSTNLISSWVPHKRVNSIIINRLSPKHRDHAVEIISREIQYISIIVDN